MCTDISRTLRAKARWATGTIKVPFTSTNFLDERCDIRSTCADSVAQFCNGESNVFKGDNIQSLISSIGNMDIARQFEIAIVWKDLGCERNFVHTLLPTGVVFLGRKVLLSLHRYTSHSFPQFFNLLDHIPLRKQILASRASSHKIWSDNLSTYVSTFNHPTSKTVKYSWRIVLKVASRGS